MLLSRSAAAGKFFVSDLYVRYGPKRPSKVKMCKRLNVKNLGIHSDLLFPFFTFPRFYLLNPNFLMIS